MCACKLYLLQANFTSHDHKQNPFSISAWLVFNLKTKFNHILFSHYVSKSFPFKLDLSMFIYAKIISALWWTIHKDIKWEELNPRISLGCLIWIFAKSCYLLRQLKYCLLFLKFLNQNFITFLTCVNFQTELHDPEANSLGFRIRRLR